MKQCKKVGLPVLSILLTCFFPCGFMFFQNAGEARAADMLPFFGIFLLTAGAVFLIAAGILRNMGRAAALTDFAMVVVINFTMVCGGIKSVFPGFRDKFLLIAAGLAGLGLLILFLKKKPDLTAVCGLIALTFGTLTVVNLIPAIPTLVAAARYTPGAVTEPVETFTQPPRNIYYFIFDEYGGQENLVHYFDYDNEEFLTGLEERGFSVSNTSRNTESPWTVTLVPNMMNLSYVTDDSVPINNRTQWLENPLLYQLFTANGYEINLINQNGFLGEEGCRVLSRNQFEETISVYLYENSIFCLIPKVKWVIEEQVLGRGERGYVLALDNVMDAMKDCWRQAQGAPTLTVGYFLAPHGPFLFDGEGTMQRPEEYYNWKRPELYLAKLQYTNQQILEAVDNIIAHDPEAVILLQGDHGCRLPGHLVNEYGGPWFDETAEIPYMENVLCCAYVPGQTVDVTGESCINATRKVLDTVYGTTFGTLEPPEDYAIPREYMPPSPDRLHPPEGTHPAGNPPSDLAPPAGDREMGA